MNQFSKPCFWHVLNHYCIVSSLLVYLPLISVYILTILDWFGLYRCGVARHRHKPREVAPVTMFFCKTHAVLFIRTAALK